VAVVPKESSVFVLRVQNMTLKIKTLHKRIQFLPHGHFIHYKDQLMLTVRINHNSALCGYSADILNDTAGGTCIWHWPIYVAKQHTHLTVTTTSDLFKLAITTLYHHNDQTVNVIY
jgi:hypothetical protein